MIVSLLSAAEPNESDERDLIDLFLVHGLCMKSPGPKR